MVFFFILPILILLFLVIFAEPEHSTGAGTGREWPTLQYNCDVHCDCGHSPMVVVDDHTFFCEKCNSEFQED